MTKRYITCDANEAVASVAHRVSEVISVYPITPASAMGELCDEWSAAGRENLWGQVPRIVQMQSEGGAAGAVHGALQAGSLATTFTASQGLLLMIPNLYKIAGELTPFVLHVAARTLATHALSIFCDHSDVMSCRGTGLAMLAASSVQEAQDLAAIAHAATLESRVPILHFFDGFRTSHELAKIIPLEDEALHQMIDLKGLAAHRDRAMRPEAPTLRGTAQNPDTFFQAREAANPFYDACPKIIQSTMDRFALLTGRQYRLFDYYGHPEAEQVVILIGSASQTIQDAIDWANQQGKRFGCLQVRLYRPFDISSFVEALPQQTKTIAVLDRTKEPGAIGDPLYLDVVAALYESNRQIKVVGGRYGLSSKEVIPAMLLAVFDELQKESPKNHFTLGINDDVTRRSLAYDAALDIETPETIRALFYGLGSDGTVGSNKNTIKIIGEETPFFAQGYFVYDSRKAGAVTVSHLRFGPKPIRAAYQIQSASFVACHQPQLIERYEMLEKAQVGATFLLNAPWPTEDVFALLPREVQSLLIDKKLRFFVIDAQTIAEDAGLGKHISTVMQACFFYLSGVLPQETAMLKMREAIQKSFGKRGDELVRRNLNAIDGAVSHLVEIPVPLQLTTNRTRPSPVPKEAPDFVQRVTASLLAGHGDLLPVSAFPVDGVWPTDTAKWDKRSLALELPSWDPKVCIQCNKCVLICPHNAIQAKVFDKPANAPLKFLSTEYKGAEYHGQQYTIQVSPDDCTGCGLCANFCPAKDKGNPRHKALDMLDAAPRKPEYRENFSFYQSLPMPARATVHLDVKGSQFLESLFSSSGACAGCGETPYLKLLTQLFGDRALIANATGCSSIYGGNLPTTPWAKNSAGHGPAWSNSLFEDNAEFGLGLRLGADALREKALRLLISPSLGIDGVLIEGLKSPDTMSEAGVEAQRERIRILQQKIKEQSQPEAVLLSSLADSLLPKSVWIVGGDGWAYDIGYGGLDHVLASGENVNVLVLDTEVYSNTGGQQSKATPIGASAKFASAGKEHAKKDLGLLAMTYGSVYVARVAMGAKDAQTVKAFIEAEQYPGPSLIIAYCHCIAHGYDLSHGAEQQRLAVEAGLWPLYRFDPRKIAQGEPPLHLDMPAPKIKPRDYMKNEGRFRAVELADPTRYKKLLQLAEQDASVRYAIYEQLAKLQVKGADRT